MAFSISQRRAIPFPNAPTVPSIGFGFNIAPTFGHPPSPNVASVQSPPRQPLGTPNTSVRNLNPTSTKRRWEADAETEREDENMGARSPSPSDRPKKGPPKRVRVDDRKTTGPAGDKPSQEQHESDSIDAGVLLASLPPASLLTILTSLITQNPQIKPLLIPLIPRPTLEAALSALNDAARKIKDAHPYSSSSTSVQPPSLGFGFGSPQVFRPSAGSSSSSFGMGMSRPGASSSTSSPMRNLGSSGTISDGYILSRIRPSVSDFASTARSYMSYFTSRQPTQSSASASQNPIPELVHPSESFTFLSTLTTHILRLSSSSSQTRTLFVREHADSLLLRVTDEWKAWLERLHKHVNEAGGMYASGVVQAWDRGLEEMVALEAGLAPYQSPIPSSGDEHSHGHAEVPTSSKGFGGTSIVTGGLRHQRPLPRRHGQSLPATLPQPSPHQRSPQPQPPLLLQNKPLKAVRDEWIAKVGWLIGKRVVRSGSEAMDEDEEL